MATWSYELRVDVSNRASESCLDCGIPCHKDPVVGWTHDWEPATPHSALLPL